MFGVGEDRFGPNTESTLPSGGTRTPNTLLQFASVRLFIERAAAVHPGFRLTSGAEAAAVALICRRPERAIRLLGAEQAFCETLGARPPVAVGAEYERTVAEGRAALGEAAFAAVWAEGQVMSLDQTIEYVLGEA